MRWTLTTYINNSCYVALDRCTAEQKINLIVIVPIPFEVFNDSQTALAVCHCGIVIVLFAVLVD